MPALLPDSLAAYNPHIGLALLVILFIGFVLERLPPVVLAVTGGLTMFLLGFLSTDELLGVFSNSAPITIAAMFVLSGALLRTGTLEEISGWIIRRTRRRPRRAVAEIGFGTLAASAFMNNTPVVLVMIPIVKRLSKALGLAATRLLIPMSYLTILGGTLTLILFAVMLTARIENMKISNPSQGLPVAIGLVAVILLILGISSFMFFSTARSHFEAEIGVKLQDIVQIIARNTSFERLNLIQVGGYDARKVLRLKQKVSEIGEATGVKKIYVFNMQMGSLLDLSPGMPIGSVYNLTRFLPSFMHPLKSGQAVHGIGYIQDQDRFLISAYAPILDAPGKLLAVVGVDAVQFKHRRLPGRRCGLRRGGRGVPCVRAG